MVLDEECRHIQAVSNNLTQLLDMAEPAHQPLTLGSVLGKRLSRRLSKELQGQQRLAGPLAFSRGAIRFQLHAYRTESSVIVEIEPLNPLGKRRLLGTVNERLMRLAEATQQEELLEII